MNTGDTAFVLVSAAFVLLMTPGLALFYGGMVRNKNVLGTIMQSFICIALVSLEWILWGYSMAFGPDHWGTAGALTWTLLECKQQGKTTSLGAASGAIAGLATVTPAAGFVGPLSAAVIGILAGTGCYYGIMIKSRFGYDDSLDVVGIHGVGGAIGLIATGLFASKAVNPGGANGLFFGNPSQVWIQCVAVLVTIVYAFTLSYLFLKLVDKLIGLRISEQDEIAGLDLSQHDETAYTF